MKHVYQYADTQIAFLKAETSAEFQNAANAIPFDEMNVIEVKAQVKALFTRLKAYAVKVYRKIAKDAYEEALQEAERLGLSPADDKLTEDVTNTIVVALLAKHHPMTEYVFSNEAKRKRDRLSESVLSAKDRTALRNAYGKAARLWFGQVRQYADLTVDDARERAFADAGVKWVQWVTERDAKVCSVCGERDAEIYPADNVPHKPHRGCRCHLMPMGEK